MALKILVFNISTTVRAAIDPVIEVDPAIKFILLFIDPAIAVNNY
jgi:hypothetical protein